MTIQILGGGCRNCDQLEANARLALQTLGIEAGIEKVKDADRILEMGVMRTPALAVDGEVKLSGRVFTPEAIAEVLGASAAAAATE